MLSRWKIMWMPVVIRCPSSLRVLMMQQNGTTGASFCSMGSLSLGCPHLRCSNQATSNVKSYMELWILRVPNWNHSKSAKRRLVGCIYSCTLRRFFAENYLCQGRSFSNNPCCVSIIQARFVNFCKQLCTCRLVWIPELNALARQIQARMLMMTADLSTVVHLLWCLLWVYK